MKPKCQIQNLPKLQKFKTTRKWFIWHSHPCTYTTKQLTGIERVIKNSILVFCAVLILLLAGVTFCDKKDEGPFNSSGKMEIGHWRLSYSNVYYDMYCVVLVLCKLWEF